MATKKVDIGETLFTDRQLASRLKETFGQLAEGALTGDHIQALNEHRDGFAPAKSVNVDLNDQVERWRHHFKTLYRMNPDFSGLYIPERAVGFDRLIIVPKGLTHKKWVETARTIHEVSLYSDDLDGVVTVNNRTPKDRSYGVWIRDRQEADEELKGESAKSVANMDPKVSGIVLLERLVGGTGYLFEKMCHMDWDNWTLCAGSRDSDGYVPYVLWHSDLRRVCVGWYLPSLSSPRLRARAVVS